LFFLTNLRIEIITWELSAIAGFGVLITFGFFIYIVSRDRAQLVGLGIRFAHLPSPPIPATAESQTLCAEFNIFEEQKI